MYDDFNDQHSYISQAVPDTVNVILGSCHQFPGIVPVIKICGQPLKMTEQVVPHIGAYLSAYNVKQVFLKVCENASAHPHS